MPIDYQQKYLEVKAECLDLKWEIKELKKEVVNLRWRLTEQNGLQECKFCEVEMAPDHWPNCSWYIKHEGLLKN